MSTESGYGDNFINKGVIEYIEENCCFNVTERQTVELADVLYKDNETLEVIRQHIRKSRVSRGGIELEEILKEIIEGKKAYRLNQARPYADQVTRGKGTKLYLTKRIDLLREKLLEIKKELR